MSRKTWLIVLPTMVVLSVGAMLAFRQSPRVVVPEQSFSFGSTSEGEIVEHEFKLHNAGHSVLRILGVWGSCGCTTIMRSAASIVPGADGSIVVRYDSEGHFGPIDDYIHIATNDPNHPSLDLMLTGFVNKRLRK